MSTNDIAVAATAAIITAIKNAIVHKDAATLRADIYQVMLDALADCKSETTRDPRKIVALFPKQAPSPAPSNDDVLASLRRQLYEKTSAISDDAAESAAPDVMGRIYNGNGDLLPHDGDRDEPEPKFEWNPDDYTHTGDGSVVTR